MLHWTPPASLAFVGAVDPVAVPGSPRVQDLSRRASHARMLSHAATRRRAAVASLSNACRVDALYWKACAPDAVAKARALREQGFSSLP
jgi:hypothetical protein